MVAGYHLMFRLTSPDDVKDGDRAGTVICRKWAPGSGPGLAAAAGDAVVPLAGEGVDAGGVVGGLAEGAAQPGVALAFLAGAGAGPDWRAEGIAQDSRGG
jgi:hypothetical protein